MGFINVFIQWVYQCVLSSSIAEKVIQCVLSMCLSNGFIQCVYLMGLSNGFIQCVYPMGLSNGFILWVYPMGLSNGSCREKLCCPASPCPRHPAIPLIRTFNPDLYTGLLPKVLTTIVT
jgi:hypothetical protein